MAQTVEIPWDLPWSGLKITAASAGEAIELVFDERVTEVAFWATVTDWLVASRGTAGMPVGDYGVPIPEKQWHTPRIGIEWDPSPKRIGRLWVQAPSAAAVLYVAAG